MSIIIDASVPVCARTPVWPGEPSVVLSPLSRISDGDSCNVTAISAGLHAGTHLDAPRHFIDGAEDVACISLATLMGPAWVQDISDVSRAVEAKHLAGIPECERLILKTANTVRELMSKFEFTKDYAHVAESAARFIAGSGVKLLGIDYLSVEKFDSDSHIVHHILLGNGIIVVEGLDLSEVEGGWWEIACLPLKIAEADGSPVRAVFIRD